MDKKGFFKIISLTSDKSFVSYLHETRHFDKRRYSKFKKAIRFFVENKTLFSETEKREIIRTIVIGFEHFLFLFYCDEHKKDWFKIKPKLNSDKKLDLYFEIRDMTDLLFDCLK